MALSLIGAAGLQKKAETDMRKILCFGDSNTYGFDPRDWLDCRYPAPVRWTNRLEVSAGWQVLNYGENGREIPHSQWAIRQLDDLLERERPIDCLLIMLGTNDILNSYRPSAPEVTARMQQVLQHITEKEAGLPVLLVAPVPVRTMDTGKNLASAELCTGYEQAARKFAIPFADAGQWDVSLAFDGVHFSEEGHAIFAKEIETILRGVWKESEQPCIF